MRLALRLHVSLHVLCTRVERYSECGNHRALMHRPCTCFHKGEGVCCDITTLVALFGKLDVTALPVQAIDRRERLRRLALETIDLSKDPYFMRNHLGQYECRLCLTLHNNEGNYLAHTQVTEREREYLYAVVLFATWRRWPLAADTWLEWSRLCKLCL